MRERGFFSLTTACLYTFLLAALLSMHSYAQSFQPIRTYWATSVFVEGQAMYVLGGRQNSDERISGQFFSLDLSTSWNMTSPLFRSFSDGYWILGGGGTLSKDKKDWLIFGNRSIYNYNFDSSTWSILYDTQPNLWWWNGLSAVTDPDTGRIFVPNGLKDRNDNKTSLLIVYPEDIALKTWHTNVMEPRLVNVTLYSLAWAPMLNGFLLFGGWEVTSNTTLGSLYTYSIRRGWEAFDATGDVPSARSESCLVPAYSGSKMVLFGGRGSYDKTIQISPALSDIYILDVAKRIWTRGPNVGIGGARIGHVCAVSGDYFISWGGTVDTTSPISNTVVYNLKTSTWTSRYEYPPS